MVFKFIFRKKKYAKKKTSSRILMNEWLELSKEERLERDLNEKNESMRRKKNLLKSIRDEYIKIKKEKS